MFNRKVVLFFSLALFCLNVLAEPIVIDLSNNEKTSYKVFDFNVNKKAKIKNIIPGIVIVKYKNKLQPVTSANNIKLNSVILNVDNIPTPNGIKINKIKPLFPDYAKKNKLLKQLNTSNKRARLLANNVNMKNIFIIEVDNHIDIEKVVKAFNQMSEVEYAQPNHKIELYSVPNDPYYSSVGSWGQTEDDLWGLKKIKSEKAWDITKGENVIVAVVDSGVYIDHPDIAENIWVNSGEIPNNGIDDDNNGYIDDVNGWNFEMDSNNVMDEVGHGTHVAGIIAAIGDNKIGIVGAAPKSKIMPVTLGYDDITASQALMYAANNGASVINNSWGVMTGSAPLLEETIKIIYNMGVTLVFAAGNSSADLKFSTPGNMSEVIVVGASTPNDKSTDFSNFGMMDVTAPGGSKPDFSLAPDYAAVFDSVNSILSLLSPNSIFSDFAPAVGNDYLRLAGTSMSAPYVTGVIAQIQSIHPNYTPEKIRQVLHLGADDIMDTGFDINTGFGRINALKTLNESIPLEVVLRTQTSALNTIKLDVIGTILGKNLESWVLEYGLGADPNKWVKIVEGTNQFNHELIINWDASKLQENNNVLRLSALSQNGKYYVDYQGITVDRLNISSPNYTHYTLNGKDLASFGHEVHRTGTQISIKGTVNPAGLQNYYFEVERIIENDVGQTKNAVPVEDSHFILPSGGTENVIDDVIAVWDTSNIDIAGSYHITLTINTTMGQEVLNTYVVIDPWIKTGFPVLNDWWLDSTGIQYVDLNKDGKPELAVGMETKVHFYDEFGIDIPGWPNSISIDPNNIAVTFLSPNVVDLDNDGEYEVVTMNTNGNVFIWSATGVLKEGWPIQINSKHNGEITIADINNDGIEDIIVISRGNLNVFDLNGSQLNGFPVQFSEDYIEPHAVTGDMNGDGLLEIALIQPDYLESFIHVYQSDGSQLPGWPISLGKSESFTWSSYKVDPNPTMADLNKDGKDELIYGDYSGNLHAYKENGTDLSGWPVFLKNAAFRYISIADFDQDGYLDVIASIDADYLFNNGKVDLKSVVYKILVVNNKAEILSGWPISKLEKNVLGIGTAFSEPMVANIDDDDELEIVVAGQLKRDGLFIHAFNLDGSEVISDEYPKPMTSSGLLNNSFALADIDNDGLMELATIAENGGVYAWDTTVSSSTNAPWSMKMNNNAQTRRAVNTQQFSNDPFEIIPAERIVKKNQYFTIKYSVRNDFEENINKFKLEYKFDVNQLEIISIKTSNNSVSEYNNLEGDFKINALKIAPGEIISSTIRIKAKAIGETKISPDEIKLTIDGDSKSISGNDIEVTVLQ